MVSEVLSGDTVVLEDGSRVRYAGVRAPGAGEPLEGESRQENARYVLRQKVRYLPVEGMGPPLHAYVFVPNSTGRVHLLVQLEMLERGLVHLDPATLSEGPYQDEMIARAERARKAGRGVHAGAAGPGGIPR